MKKLIGLFCILVAAVFTVVAVDAAYAADTPLYEKRINLAVKLIDDMAKQSDASAMAQSIKESKGVAIFPDVAKAGFIIGAEEGQGLVLLRTESGGWSGPAFMGIAGASVGLQAGIESLGLVLVINNDEGLKAFTGGNSFKLGADIGVAAGPVGSQVGNATTAPLKASLYSYSLAKGVFAGISVNGSIINQNRDLNLAYWGKDMTAQQALAEPATNQKILPLLQALNSLIEKAR
ncbi:MAG: lipid-binding SYLF domain-containing protein [Synergistaceae bacterium]|nr:lipid-binding SYLF domain-containing protein [Synergistaceae bacterium]